MPSNSKEYQRAYQRQYRKNSPNRRRVVSVSFGHEDFEEISAYASSQDMSLSALLREASLMQTRNAQLCSQEVEEELRQLRFVISNIANNLNQIAHHSNLVRQVTDENAVFQELKKLDELVTDFTTNRMSET